MTPAFSDDWLTVHQGDCRAVMSSMEPESVHCVVTSPPYWGLRDYGTATWVGGDELHEHRGSVARTAPPGTEKQASKRGSTDVFSGDCKCGATRVDAQLGLEPTPEQYVENMVAVFREVRRVLRSDGTVWLNLGDSYATGPTGTLGDKITLGGGQANQAANLSRPSKLVAGLKPKDLVGIPWRVAFALQQPYYTGDIKDERDRMWLSALMDGEGTFTILSTTSSSAGSLSYPPVAQVRMTSQGVVTKAASLVGVASPAQYPPSNGGSRAIYQWRLSGARAASVARELYPYLIEKRRQAIVVWNHQQVREGYTTKRGVGMPDEDRAKQQVCRDLIRRMNHGEHVDLPSWMVEPPSLNEPGWYLRSDVIWSKPNPMPESVTDRPTKSHEYLFLLSKSPRYYFDAAAVRIPAAAPHHRTMDSIQTAQSARPPGTRAHQGLHRATDKQRGHGRRHAGFNDRWDQMEKAEQVASGANIRSVWTVATQPYPGAHFATFPPKLVEPCIKAGSPEGGTVLDPFAGSGTTGLVAQRLSRRAVLIELNADYLSQVMDRNRDIPLGLGA